MIGKLLHANKAFQSVALDFQSPKKCLVSPSPKKGWILVHSQGVNRNYLFIQNNYPPVLFHEWSHMD